MGGGDERHHRRVFLHVAQDAVYERAVLGMDTARAAGALHVGLVKARG